MFNDTVCVPGQVTEGAISSTRFTVNEQLAVFPLPSLAVRVTVVLPTPVTCVPNAGAWVKAGVLQLSDMVAGL